MVKDFESVFSDPKTKKVLDVIEKLVKSMKPPRTYVNLKGEVSRRDGLKERENYVERTKNGKS